MNEELVHLVAKNCHVHGSARKCSLSVSVYTSAPIGRRDFGDLSVKTPITSCDSFLDNSFT